MVFCNIFSCCFFSVFCHCLKRISHWLKYQEAFFYDGVLVRFWPFVDRRRRKTRKVTNIGSYETWNFSLIHRLERRGKNEWHRLCAAVKKQWWRYCCVNYRVRRQAAFIYIQFNWDSTVFPLFFWRSQPNDIYLNGFFYFGDSFTSCFGLGMMLDIEKNIAANWDCLFYSEGDGCVNFQTATAVFA